MDSQKELPNFCGDGECEMPEELKTILFISGVRGGRRALAWSMLLKENTERLQEKVKHQQRIDKITSAFSALSDAAKITGSLLSDSPKEEPTLPKRYCWLPRIYSISKSMDETWRNTVYVPREKRKSNHNKAAKLRFQSRIKKRKKKRK